MLSARNLSVSYGSRTALDSFTFTLYRGESLGVVGTNGAGKSTR